MPVTSDAPPVPGPGAQRQRGFSLIVVFVIIIVMVGVASAVMITTQGDLQVAGSDREQMSALYAAEAGVAWAQWVLIRFPLPTASAWTNLLKGGNPADPSYTAAMGGIFCNPRKNLPLSTPSQVAITPAPGNAPIAYNPLPGNGPPATGAPVIYDAARGVQFYWCIHNNLLDPEYGKTANCGPAGANACPDGDIYDGDGIITIESYGYYYGPAAGNPNNIALATAHLTVDVSYYNATANVGKCYGSASSCGTNTGNGGASASPNDTIDPNTGKPFATARSF